MDAKVRDAWEDYLNPKVVRRRLLVASLYVCAFEVLKDQVVDRLRDFFADGFDKDGTIVGDRYRDQVLRLHRNPFRASLLWHMNNDVIDQADIDALLAARDLRNCLAHDIAETIGQWPEGVDEVFDGLVRLLNKIEVWWISQVQIPTNPEFDGHLVDQSKIVPGTVMTLTMLRDLALAPDDEAGAYLAAYRTMSGESDAQ